MRTLLSSSISPRAKAKVSASLFYVSFLVFLVIFGGSVFLIDVWQIWERIAETTVSYEEYAESRPTMEVVRAKQKQQNANVTTTTTTTSMESIPPSKMTVHYHEMWNHTTSTIDIPEK